MLSYVSVLLAVVALARGSIPHASVSTQYHAQDELGQYSYGYAGGPSSKTETKTADGVVRGGYSYVDGHGLVQSASYVADPHHGFRVAATNLPVAPAAPAPVAPLAPVIKAAPVPVAPVLPAPAVPAVIPAPAPVAAPAVYHAAAPAVYHAAAPTLYHAAAPAVYHAAAPAIYHAAAPVAYAPGYLAGVETPEVTIAKAHHIAQVHQTKALLHSWRRKRSIPHAYAAYPYAYAVPKGFAYSSVTHHYPTPSYYHAAAPAYGYAGPYAAPAYTPYAPAHVAAPLPVGDTPEVAAAKAAHFAAVHEAKARVGAAAHHVPAAYPAYPYAAHHAASYVPVPVTDTPEVAHAKAAHLAAVHEAKSKAYAHPW